MALSGVGLSGWFGLPGFEGSGLCGFESGFEVLGFSGVEVLGMSKRFGLLQVSFPPAIQN